MRFTVYNALELSLKERLPVFERSENHLTRVYQVRRKLIAPVIRDEDAQGINTCMDGALQTLLDPLELFILTAVS